MLSGKAETSPYCLPPVPFAKTMYVLHVMKNLKSRRMSFNSFSLLLRYYFTRCSLHIKVMCCKWHLLEGSNGNTKGCPENASTGSAEDGSKRLS